MGPRLSALFVTTLLTAASFAQTFLGPGFAHATAVTPGFAGFGVTTTTTGAAPAFSHHFHHHPFGNAGGIFFSDLGYEPVSSQPVSVIVVQPPAPAAPPTVEESHPPAKPLLLELQGDRWVQVEHFQMTRGALPDHNAKAQTKNAPEETLLVFRDGHSESTTGYAVIGDALYEQRNYWASGSWTKKIAMADLDLPATIQANQQQGLRFRLPAGPNEVVLQP